MTRAQINNELALANASSTADKLAETGTTTPSTTQNGTSILQQEPQTLLSHVAQLNTQMAQSNQNVATIPSTTPNTYTLPNGAVISSNGTIITPAPVQTALIATYNPVPPQPPLPVSRILEVSLQSNAPEIHSKLGEAVLRAPLFPFVLKPQITKLTKPPLLHPHQTLTVFCDSQFSHVATWKEKRNKNKYD
jgi:hypothetical protein